MEVALPQAANKDPALSLGAQAYAFQIKNLVAMWIHPCDSGPPLQIELSDKEYLFDVSYHTPRTVSCKYVFCKNFCPSIGRDFSYAGRFPIHFYGEKPT